MADVFARPNRELIRDCNENPFLPEAPASVRLAEREYMQWIANSLDAISDWTDLRLPAIAEVGEQLQARLSARDLAGFAKVWAEAQRDIWPALVTEYTRGSFNLEPRVELVGGEPPLEPARNFLLEANATPAGADSWTLRLSGRWQRLPDPMDSSKGNLTPAGEGSSADDQAGQEPPLRSTASGPREQFDVKVPEGANALVIPTRTYNLWFTWGTDPQADDVRALATRVANAIASHSMDDLRNIALFLSQIRDRHSSALRDLQRKLREERRNYDRLAITALLSNTGDSPASVLPRWSLRLNLAGYQYQVKVDDDKREQRHISHDLEEDILLVDRDGKPQPPLAVKPGEAAAVTGVCERRFREIPEYEAIESAMAGSERTWVTAVPVLLPGRGVRRTIRSRPVPLRAQADRAPVPDRRARRVLRRLARPVRR